LQDNGKVGVLNQCSEASGRKKIARGTAKVADKYSNAKLKVTFFWPFYGDYWIINLGSNYEYAVVGEPRRRYFWILSRTPEIEDRTYGEIIDKAKKQGYDLGRIIRTRQP
jgi:apolipoprotein D and lipocalin family protein